MDVYIPQGIWIIVEVKTLILFTRNTSEWRFKHNKAQLPVLTEVCALKETIVLEGQERVKQLGFIQNNGVGWVVPAD